MCWKEQAIKILDWSTYGAASGAALGFFDNHSGGIMAICAVATFAVNLYLKWHFCRKCKSQTKETE